jgi:hypothetical protein
MLRKPWPRNPPLAANVGAPDELRIGRAIAVQNAASEQRFLAVVALRRGSAHVTADVAQDARGNSAPSVPPRTVSRPRLHLLVGRARHQHFDERVALAVALDFERLADRLPADLSFAMFEKRHPARRKRAAAG